MNTIMHLEIYKNELNKQLNKRIEEINAHSMDTEGNWRLSEIQKLTEEIQHYTNAIFALKNLGEKE